MWKVYRIDDGRIIKAGFETDDQAKDWLERRNDLAEDEYDVEEMDEEEIAEFTDGEDDDDEGVYSRQAKVISNDDDDDDDFASGDMGDIDYGEGDGEDDEEYDDDEEDDGGDDDDDDDY